MAKDFSIVRFIVSIGLIALGVAGFFLMGKPDLPVRPPAESDLRLVKTFIAPDHTDGIQFEVDGVVVPFRQVDIAAQVGGRVDYKADQCRTGHSVKKGDLLFRIEQEDYELEVRRLEEEAKQADAMLGELGAEISTVENQIEAAREQLTIDERQLARNKQLSSQRAASQSEVDAARRAELTSRNNLQKLQDDKTLLESRRVRLESEQALQQANLTKASLALQRTEIRSPLDGIVVSEDVEEDGYVQIGSTVIRIQDASQLDVTCQLHMRQMHWLYGNASTENDAESFPKTPATVTYNLNGTKYQWPGVVDRLDGAGIDPQTRMVPCRVNVANPKATNSTDLSADSPATSPTLMTGMFVKVRIDAQPPIALVRLPHAAIQPGNKVWTIDHGKLKSKPVVIANSTDNHVVAYQQTDGLKAGDVIVVSPMATPSDGGPVKDIAKASPDELNAAKPSGGWRGGPPGGKPGGKPGNGKPDSGRRGGNPTAKAVRS